MIKGVSIIPILLSQLAGILSEVTYCTGGDEFYSPCHCAFNGIACLGENVTEIKLEQLFTKLSAKLNDKDKRFERLILMDTKLKELKNNTFKDIKLDQINIEYNHDLVMIHQDAFNGTNRETQYIEIEGNSKLDNWVFSAISTFTEVEQVQFLNNDAIEEIPAKAFKFQQNKLKLVQFSGKNIKKIGDNAFTILNNLDGIVFNTTSLENISARAFEFRNSTKKINIGFFFLNNSNPRALFDKEVLDLFNRPAYLVFALGNFTELEANIFGSFLEANPKNKVDVVTYSPPQYFAKKTFVNCPAALGKADPYDKFYACIPSIQLDNF